MYIKSLKNMQPFDSVISFLKMYSKEIVMCTDDANKDMHGELIYQNKTYKQPKCPVMGRWLRSELPI